MATAKNDITGDLISTKVSSNNYRDNYDAIFRKKTEEDNEIPSNDFDDDYECEWDCSK